MPVALSETVLARIDGAEALYHRLILVAAPSGAGKTEALRRVAASTGAPLVNLNLELSRRMLDLTERERSLRLPELLDEVVGRDAPLVLLDNIELLFDVAFEHDPLRLLQGVSRNRTIVAAWNGTLDNGYLSYAVPDHPEFRRYSRAARGDVAVVCPDAPDRPRPPQGHRPRRTPHPRPPPRVRRVPRLPAAPPEALPPRSRPRGLPPRLAGRGLHYDRRGRTQDPRRRAPRRPHAVDVVRPSVDARSPDRDPRMSTEIAVSTLTLSDAHDVDELMKRNSQTLGFLPRRVLDEYIRQRTAIGAKTVSGELAGYLLYAANPVRFRVAHLCVADAFRGQGIARRLIDALRDAATTQTGIRLHCRRDYPANELWPVLGFLPLGERPARTPNRKLTLWYLDLTPENRLGLFRAQASDETVDIVVDSQVFFDLHEPDDDTTTVSKSLLLDFMADSVRILLTDEVYQEIYRNRDPEQRELSRQHARGFPTVEYDPRSADRFAAALSKLLPDCTRSQKSDIQHLAKTAASQVRTFVTRDEKLLRESATISTLTRLQVVSPADVVVQHHKLLERQSYGPSRVAGVDLVWRRWAHDDFSRFPFELFLNDGERKGNFKTKLNHFFADPKLSTVEILYRENNAIAIRVLARDSGFGLIGQVVRIARTVDQRQFGRFVFADLLAKAVDDDLCMVRVDSDAMTSGLSHELLEAGFTECGGDFVKFTLSTCLDRPTTLKKIRELSPQSLDTYRDLKDLGLEGHCSPLSLRGTDQKYFTVPVRPAYAMSLFDRRQSADDFFGGETEILLRWQNVYYRKATQHRMIRPPGRILWYVSGRKNMQIVAVSRLDDVAVDTPKVLFRKFQKFGILKWNDLCEMCDGEVTTEIMALLFSHTFLFREPISLATMREIYSERGIGLTLQSPQRIPAHVFEEVFQRGFRRRS